MQRRCPAVGGSDAPLPCAVLKNSSHAWGVWSGSVLSMHIVGAALPPVFQCRCRCRLKASVPFYFPSLHSAFLASFPVSMACGIRVCLGGVWVVGFFNYLNLADCGPAGCTRLVAVLPPVLFSSRKAANMQIIRSHFWI